MRTGPHPPNLSGRLNGIGRIQLVAILPVIPINDGIVSGNSYRKDSRNIAAGLAQN
jgi:hypothetical protein